MNIFYLDHDVTKCAQQHTDRHVVKMIVEYAQILSTAHRTCDGIFHDNRYIFLDDREQKYYRATHIHHPSTKWACENQSNYQWLADLFKALCLEYTHRYGKVHKTELDRKSALLILPNHIPNGAFTQPPPAMPLSCVIPNDAVQSYRNYYNQEKRHLFSWKHRSEPTWIIHKQKV